MDGGSGEGQRPQGELGHRGLLCCNAEFDYAAHPDYWPEPFPPGKGQGKGKTKGPGKEGPTQPPQWRKSAAPRAKPTTGSADVSADHAAHRFPRGTLTRNPTSLPLARPK